MTTTVVVGDGNVAADLFKLLERRGVRAVRVATSEAPCASEIRRAEVVVDASGLEPESKKKLLLSLFENSSREALICSDESVIPRHELLNGVPHEFRKRFSICHFFVPTENLSLVEWVPGEEIEPDVQSYLSQFLESRLERTVVQCPDTPGFIANRIGLFFAFRGVILAMEYGVRPDHADIFLAAHFGVPRLGVFGLFDLVGFEVMRSIAENMRTRLSKTDPWQSCELARETLRGAHGASSGVGFRFYRKDEATGDRRVLDLGSLEYIPRTDGSIDPKRGAKLVAQLACELDACCSKVVDSTKVTPDVVDHVMCSGFGWRQGPFALLKLPTSLLSKGVHSIG